MPYEQRTTVTLTQDGSVYLAGERLNVSQLRFRLRALGLSQPIVIRADSASDYKRVLEVVDACKAASIQRISLASVASP